MRNPVEHQAFYDARNRCTNPKCKDFPNYGGRGIKFLFATFEEFFAEVGTRPGSMVSFYRPDVLASSPAPVARDVPVLYRVLWGRTARHPSRRWSAHAR